MRARRSRSQYALRWERERPARNPDHARKKNYPFKEGDTGGEDNRAHLPSNRRALIMNLTTP